MLLKVHDAALEPVGSIRCEHIGVLVARTVHSSKIEWLCDPHISRSILFLITKKLYHKPCRLYQLYRGSADLHLVAFDV